MHRRSLGVLVALSVLAACEGAISGSDDAPGRDAGMTDGNVADAASDGSTADVPIDAPVAALTITAPAAGADVYESVLIRASAPMGVTSVQFFVGDETTPRCVDDAAPFRCLVSLDPAGPAGPVTFRARGMPSGDASVVAMRRLNDVPPCVDGLGTCIARWVTEGTAAGFTGITYENRDGTHALYDTSGMPGITALTNDDSNGNWGLAGPSMDRNAIVVANVSKAYTAISASLVRYDVAFASNYARYEPPFLNSKLFFYPEHVDCGVEDYYSFMTPAVFTSQGSSGSELDEVAKHLSALAAFSPAVRARLHTENMLMSVLTMIHRRTRVASDAAYLTGAAHPTAFGDYDNGLSMGLFAHSLTETTTPPIASLAVSGDTSMRQVATGPTMIARAFTMMGPDEYALTVDATASRDLNGRPLTYHWRVLRGDASSVTMTPMNDDESVMRFTFRRAPETTYEGDGFSSSTRISRRSSLVSIGLFVHNGQYFSSPVFVTSYALDPARGAPGDNNLD